MKYQRHGEHIYRTKRWQALRFQILRRDNFRCVKCGSPGPLEVDHIKPISEAPTEAFGPFNLQTLCKTCHSRKTRREVSGPMTPEKEAWRELVLRT